ncbi:MAG: hypothetical protein NPIRA01_02310 [Nitrospirales bacterium]|nr:MAG: hypothetical protein NPIRA01_02310 [Nitrospirales bacterium]
MTPESLELSIFTGRLVIAVTALTHSLLATFIVGASLIGAVTATLHILTGRTWYRRLAHMIAFALVLTTATISFFGVLFVIALNVFWPRFWHQLFQVMFWLFLLEAALFLCEAFFAYAWFYLWQWGESGWRRLVHLSFIWIAAGSSLAAMFLIDVTASYMVTPVPLDSGWENIFNPTMIHLDLHRWFGNLTWAGFAMSGICAIGLYRAQNSQDYAFYLKAGTYCFAIGFGALLLMPIIGYQYMLHLRYGQPQAFYAIMLGERSWLFGLIGLTYGLLILLGSFYLTLLIRKTVPSSSSFFTYIVMSLFTIILATAVLALPYNLSHHPLLQELVTQRTFSLGKMQPYKYYALAALVIFGLLNAIYAIRFCTTSFSEIVEHALRQRSRLLPSLLLTLASLTIVVFLAMGWVRESARAVNGYLIYGAITINDEQPTYGLDDNSSKINE